MELNRRADLGCGVPLALSDAAGTTAVPPSNSNLSVTYKPQASSLPKISSACLYCPFVVGCRITTFLLLLFRDFYSRLFFLYASSFCSNDFYQQLLSFFSEIMFITSTAVAALSVVASRVGPSLAVPLYGSPYGCVSALYRVPRIKF